MTCLHGRFLTPDLTCFFAVFKCSDLSISLTFRVRYSIVWCWCLNIPHFLFCILDCHLTSPSPHSFIWIRAWVYCIFVLVIIHVEWSYCESFRAKQTDRGGDLDTWDFAWFMALSRNKGKINRCHLPRVPLIKPEDQWWHYTIGGEAGELDVASYFQFLI